MSFIPPGAEKPPKEPSDLITLWHGTFGAYGLLAQALEHEIDHLNGILYLDHLKSHESLRKITDETETDSEDEEVSAKETTS